MCHSLNHHSLITGQTHTKHTTGTIAKNLLSHSLGSWLSQRGEAVQTLRNNFSDRVAMPPPSQLNVVSRTFPPTTPEKRSPTIQIPSNNATSSSLMSSSCPMSVSVTPPRHNNFPSGRSNSKHQSSLSPTRRRHSSPTHRDSCENRGTLFAELTQKSDTFLSISVETSLYDACKHLHQYRCHRVPCVDPEEESSVLIMMNHRDVLRYLVNHMEESSSASSSKMFDITLKELRIGSYGDNIHVVTSDTPLLTVLELLWYVSFFLSLFLSCNRKQ